MIKIGMAEGKTLVLLSNQEFTGLAGQTTTNFPDGASISLASMKAKLAIIDNNISKLQVLKTACESLVASVNEIG